MPEGEVSAQAAEQSVQVAPQGQPQQHSGLPTPEEWAEHQRKNQSYVERLKGYETMHAGFKKRGFARPEELDPWSPVIEHSKKRNLPPPAVYGILSNAVPGEEAHQNGQQAQFDPESFRTELMEKARSEAMSVFARERHSLEEQAELELLEAWSKEQWPDDDVRRSEFSDAMLVRAYKARQQYPDGHALKGDRRPLTKGELETLRKEYSDGLAKSKGAEAAAIANAAKKGSGSTPAGANAQSAPKTNLPPGGKKKPFAETSRDDLVADFDAWKAKQGGAA